QLAFLVIVFNFSFSLPKHDETQALQEEPVEEESQHTGGNTIRAGAPDDAEPKLTEEEKAAMLDFEVYTVADDEEPVQPESVQAPEPDRPIDLPTTIPVADNAPKGAPELEITAPATDDSLIEDENKAATLVEQFGEYDPTLDLGSYVFPGFDLLNDYGNIHSRVNQEELIANKNRILGTLKNYGIDIDKISATVGPTVT